VPAEEPGLFLALQGGNLPAYAIGAVRLPGVNQVTVFSEGRTQLFVMNDLAELKEGSTLPWEKTVHYYPRGGLLVTLAGKNKVVLRKLDLADRLEKSGADYLFVLPQPAAGKLGTPFSQRLDVRSKRGGVKFKVLTGPEGLAVSPEGQVTWAIPPGFPEAEANAQISVQDASGQEVVHTLRITVAEE
jgi:hypothetical protein